jgi:hypothetical protein
MPDCLHVWPKKCWQILTKFNTNIILLVATPKSCDFNLLSKSIGKWPGNEKRFIITKAGITKVNCTYVKTKFIHMPLYHTINECMMYGGIAMHLASTANTETFFTWSTDCSARPTRNLPASERMRKRASECLQATNIACILSTFLLTA